MSSLIKIPSWHLTESKSVVNLVSILDAKKEGMNNFRQRSYVLYIVCLFVFLALQHFWLYFHSPVAGFSLLILEDS